MPLAGDSKKKNLKSTLDFPLFSPNWSRFHIPGFVPLFRPKNALILSPNLVISQARVSRPSDCWCRQSRFSSVSIHWRGRSQLDFGFVVK